MKKLSVGLGKYTLLDDADYERVIEDGRTWHAHYRKAGEKEKWYVMTGPQKSKGYLKGDYLHRFVMKAPKGVVVDHVNDNPLDNRRTNLRLCTQRENMQNMRRSRKPRSGYRGVYWSILGKKWETKVTFTDSNGKKVRRHGGYFRDPKEAAEAYNRLALEVYGVFADVNTI